MVFCGDCWNNFKEFFHKRPKDLAAFSGAIALSLVTYMYGMIWVVPALIKESNYAVPVKCIILVAPTWFIIGIFSSLYYMMKRNSFALKLLPPPVQSEDLTATDDHCHADSNSGPEHELPEQDEADKLDNENESTATTSSIVEGCSKSSAEQTGTVISPNQWKFCKFCKRSVPPRSWHCKLCKNCILRRDHHCIFAMTCVGEENQANFIGFLLYNNLGATCAFFLAALYKRDCIDGTPIWLTVVKSLFWIYPLIFEFGFHNILSGILFIFMLITFGFVLQYMNLAAEGQTAFDATKKISRLYTGQSGYARIKNFLGSYPFLRILIPCFPARKIIYEHPEDCETEN